MNVQGISIIATYACNASCEHCFFGREKTVEYLDPEMLAANLESFENRFQWIHFTGGEPLLDPERFFPLLAVVSGRHSGNIGVATNGYWGTTETGAERLVEQLTAGGVDGISLSVDVFHQKSIPLEKVTNAAMAISSAGISAHCWIVASLLPEDVEGAVDENRRSLEMAQEVSAASGIPLARAEVRPIGRGNSIDCVEGPQHIPQGPCKDLACCLGETGPFEPQMIWIDQLGNVQICYGITIGSLRSRSLTDILESYDVSNNKLLKSLSEKGPAGLLRMAQAANLDVGGESFRDECDVCFRARRALRDKFPDTLSPGNAYP